VKFSKERCELSVEVKVEVEVEVEVENEWKFAGAESVMNERIHAVNTNKKLEFE
jgi:hypothetical protein